MSFLTDIIPVNLVEEKQKFDLDHSYNPQFIYSNKIDQQKLAQYGLPIDSLKTMAENIIRFSFHNRNWQDLKMMEGQKLSLSDIENKIHICLKMHHIEDKYQTVSSASFVARTTITKDTIKLRSTAEFRREGLLGMLNHEIGTHALRGVNYEQQPWFKKKKKSGFSNYLVTEEGLAVLHGLIPHTYKSLFKSALRYLAVSYSQNHSFAELYQFLSRYIQDSDLLWVSCLRCKRGLADTSQGGGYTKDLVYFEGAIKMWHWLKDHNFELGDLYLGKLAAEDADKARQMNPDFKPLLPSFYTLDKDQYVKNILEIGQANQLDQIKV